MSSHAAMAEGLSAAAAWGLAAVAATRGTARLGAYTAVLVSQAAGSIALALLVAVLAPPMTGVRGVTLLELAAGGILTLAGWLTYYEALDRGPAGTVAAIAATYGGVAALLAVAILGEDPGPVGGAGIGLAVAGAATLTSGAGRAGAPRSGALLAMASAAAYGAGAFLLGSASARSGWMPAALVTYGTAVTALLAWFPFQRSGGPRGDPRAGFAWAAAAGVAEAAALLAIAAGGQRGDVAITTALSGLYPVIPLAWAMKGGRERPGLLQAAGLAIAITGVSLVGLA